MVQVSLQLLDLFRERRFLNENLDPHLAGPLPRNRSVGELAQVDSECID